MLYNGHTSTYSHPNGMPCKVPSIPVVSNWGPVSHPGTQRQISGRERDLNRQYFCDWTPRSTSCCLNIYMRHKLHDKNKESAQTAQGNKTVCFVSAKGSVDTPFSAVQRSWMRGNCDILLNRRMNHHNSSTRSKYWFSWCFYRWSGSIMSQRDGQLYSLIVSYHSVHKMQ